jgi:hypothetical protein
MVVRNSGVRAGIMLHNALSELLLCISFITRVTLDKVLFLCRVGKSKHMVPFDKDEPSGLLPRN